MRWVVVVSVLAGCFSKPGLRDRDGGNDDAARDGASDDGAGGDGGNADAMTCSDGTWAWIGTIVHDAGMDERHPWLSADGRVLVFWRGDAGVGQLFQTQRATVDDPFGVTFQIFPAGAGNAPAEADPSLSHDLQTMHLTSFGQIVTARRSSPTSVFGSLQADSDFTLVNDIRDVTEGGFLADDGRTFLFVAGDAANPYSTEDLYIAKRAGIGAFGAPVAFPHNNTTKNECCPTMAGNLLMYERPLPSGTGQQHIVSSIYDPTTMGFSAPVEVDLPGSGSFQQPTLSADGQRLVYVVNAGNEWHLEEARLVCPQ